MKLRRSIMLPLAFLLFGAAFYIYNGVTENAWKQNLPNAIIYIVILLLLAWALRRKEKYEEKRK